MCHVTLTRLAEDFVEVHGVAEESADVDFTQPTFPGQIGKGDLTVDGNFGCDVIFGNGLETEDVGLWEDGSVMAHERVRTDKGGGYEVNPLTRGR